MLLFYFAFARAFFWCPYAIDEHVVSKIRPNPFIAASFVRILCLSPEVRNIHFASTNNMTTTSHQRHVPTNPLSRSAYRDA